MAMWWSLIQWGILKPSVATWSHPEREGDQGERFVTLLEMPLVESAETAMRLQIVKDVKANKL
jgi:hypothetical protein